MTLMELSWEYAAQAAVLHTRMNQIKAQLLCTTVSEERQALAHRYQTLWRMWREAREVSLLLERYYERGYRHNARYTL